MYTVLVIWQKKYGKVGKRAYFFIDFKAVFGRLDTEKL